MGILATIRVRIRSALTPRRRKKITIGGYRFTLKQPTMGEHYDLAESGEMRELIPKVAKLRDGVVFYQSDEFLNKVLEESEVVFPEFLKKSVEAEHEKMRLVTGVSMAAQLTLPPEIYFPLKEAVEEFTGSEVQPFLAKKNLGIWSGAPDVVEERKRQSTIRSSKNASRSTKSVTSEQIGKSNADSPSASTELSN